MGCAGAKEKIEDKMMLMKLERMEIQMEKEKELKKLAEIEGHTIKRNHVPDYIDPKFAKEKNIYDDDEDIDENDDTDANGKVKNKKGKRGVKKKVKKNKSEKKAKRKNK